MAAGRRARALFVVGMVLFGALVFLFASAYLIDREQPKWLAAVVGGLAFPVLPVVWHVVGERRRAKRLASAKVPPKTTLDPGDRYLLRAITVAVCVLAPMFVAGRFSVVRAAWDHKAWFIPEPESQYTEGNGSASKTALLAHVPSTAELVVVMRDVADEPAGDPASEPGLEAKPRKRGKSGVLAVGDHQLLMATPKRETDAGELAKGIAELNVKRDKIPFYRLDEVALVDGGDDDMLIAASEKWRAAARSPGAGPSAAIRAELDRAPDNAPLVVGYVPAATPERVKLRSAAAWIVAKQHQGQDRVVLVARVAASDAKAAGSLVSDLRGMWAEITRAANAEVPAKCREQIDAIIDDVQVERTGTTITFHLDVPGDKLMGLMLCGMRRD